VADWATAETPEQFLRGTSLATLILSEFMSLVGLAWLKETMAALVKPLLGKKPPDVEVLPHAHLPESV
jgi:hypothetical protein